jgi:hypothetical protein
MTFRTGICQNSLSQPAKGSSTNIRAIASIASSHISRLRVRSMRKPPSSAADDDSPVPNSTRPPEIRSSVATRSGHPGRMVDRRRDLKDADALAGQPIPLGPIIFACDGYDAMTSDRPYRDALSTEQAKSELRRVAGSQLDPRVLEALIAELR